MLKGVLGIWVVRYGHIYEIYITSRRGIRMKCNFTLAGKNSRGDSKNRNF